MTDKELLEKSASRFRLIAEDTLKITTGNLSHNLTSLRGFALRAAEIIDKHLKALQEEPVKRTPADIEAAMQEVEEKSRVFTEAHKGEDTDTILAQMRGEEPVSEDLGEYINKLSKQFPEVSFAKLSRISVRVAKWQKEQFEKERLKHCDALTAEQAQIESDFVVNHLKNNNRIPTFIDAIEYGMRLQKEQMMAKAVNVEVNVDAGGYSYIPQMELYDYDKDVPLAKEGDKYKVVLIKED